MAEPSIDERVAALEKDNVVLKADVAQLKDDGKKMYGILDWFKDKLSNPIVSAFITALIMAATTYIAARNNVMPGVPAESKSATVEPADSSKIDAMKERLKGGSK